MLDEKVVDLEREKRMLEGFTLMVSDSLSYHKNSGDIYIISDHLYSSICYPIPMVIKCDGVHKYPGNDLEAFCKAKLIEADCSGLVPATDKVHRVLEEDLGAKVVETGCLIKPENYQAKVYSLET